MNDVTKEVDLLISEYAKKIRNELTLEPKKNHTTEVIALAALVQANTLKKISCNSAMSQDIDQEREE